jgi:hypothetical protein
MSVVTISSTVPQRFFSSNDNSPIFIVRGVKRIKGENNEIINKA